MGRQQYDVNQYHHNGCGPNTRIHTFLVSNTKASRKASVVANSATTPIQSSNCATVCCTNQSKSKMPRTLLRPTYELGKLEGKDFSFSNAQIRQEPLNSGSITRYLRSILYERKRTGLLKGGGLWLSRRGLRLIRVDINVLKKSRCH